VRDLSLAERQVRGQAHRALFVAFGNDLEEQVGLLATERQIADLVDHQQSRGQDGAVEVGLQPALPLGRAQLQYQVCRRDEAGLEASPFKVSYLSRPRLHGP